LIDEPFRYGINFDFAVGDNGGDQLAEELAETLEADPNVTTLTYYAQTFTRSGGTSMPLMGVQPVRGGGAPTVISGRLPSGADEIALGRIAATDVDARLGDTLSMTGPTGSTTYTVVGIVALPGFGSNEGIGEGAVTTLAGFHLVDDRTQVTNAAVGFAEVSNGLDRYVAMLGEAPLEEPYVPAAIASIDRVRSIPFVLAAVLGTLAVLTLAHGMFTSLRARRHDMAVLRSLGADSGFVTRAVHWQASSFALLSVLIGLPLGFIIGRVIFARYARGIGALDGASLPFGVVLVVVAGVLVLANLVTLFPARDARRLAPATVLQRD
jgi:ABC-type lipoprotein release transport system permease subunit